MKKAITVIKAKRVEGIPPYLFAEIDRKKEEVKRKGIDVIDLGKGDPDQPTLPFIVEAMKKAIEDPSNHHYPSYQGMRAFREAVALWYRRRFGVVLDPDKEVFVLIGSKEGIAHIPLAFVNPGEVVLIPNPGYPVYQVATLFAGGVPHFMPLLEQNAFLPDLSSIPQEVVQNTKILFLNYPNNPTAAVAEAGFFERVIELASAHNIIVCHDAAYSEIGYEGYRPLSFLQVDGAKEVGVEFHSLSKTCCMTGWRIGFVVGNRDVIEGLGNIKTNVDSGVFQAIQVAGIEALEKYEKTHEQILEIYQHRRDLLVQALQECGLKPEKIKATFYMWIKVPDGYTSSAFSTLLLTKTGIIVTPGNGFGQWGEGYIRFSLTAGDEKIKEAGRRLKELKF
jgi:LL-diaminopimelate aminotransferase